MAADLAFACRSGAVQGHVAQAGSGQGDHVVFHCHDCQRFATHFDPAPRALFHARSLQPIARPHRLEAAHG